MKKKSKSRIAVMSRTEMKKVAGGGEDTEDSVGSSKSRVDCYSDPYPSGYLGSTGADVRCADNSNMLVNCWSAGYSANYVACTDL